MEKLPGQRRETSYMFCYANTCTVLSYSEEQPGRCSDVQMLYYYINTQSSCEQVKKLLRNKKNADRHIGTSLTKLVFPVLSS